ncbi:MULTISPECIES: hypothetical protein [unclassified Legionella]|uniref:hypothetical protein n=1 Tax=unclassified Legionella TaxID=2622702 RepID=UPI001E4491B9|nr:hypothetical protein [Legionella sp. 31fI33]MCC5014533.1 hypothetical protein [Legionella sp. 31fI33]
MFGFFEEPALIPRVELGDGNFNYKSANHLDIIGKRCLRFQQAQKHLHRIDNNIIRGAVIGSASWVGSYVFPLVTVSIAAFCFATYHYAHHAEAFKQYQEALNDLIAAYNWSMGRNTGDHWYKLGVLSLQDLVLTLGPCVKSETICTWSMGDLEPASMLSRAKRDNEPTTLFKAKLTQFAAGEQTKEWRFKIYGEGGTDDLWSVFLQSNGKDLATEAVRRTALSSTG